MEIHPLVLLARESLDFDFGDLGGCGGGAVAQSRGEATAVATLSSKSGGWCVDADEMDCGEGAGRWTAPPAIV